MGPHWFSGHIVLVLEAPPKRYLMQFLFSHYLTILVYLISWKIDLFYKKPVIWVKTIDMYLKNCRNFYNASRSSYERRGTLSHGFNYLADTKLFMFLIEFQQPQLGIYILSSNTTFPRQNRRQAVTASQLKLVELYDSQRRPGKSRRAAAANSNGRSWPTLGWW